MAKKRTHFIAVQLDGAYRLKTLVPVLKALVEECKKDKAVGIGLVSMLGFEDSAKTLRVLTSLPSISEDSPQESLLDDMLVKVSLASDTVLLTV